MEVWANVLFALSMVNLVMLCIGICCRKALPKAYVPIIRIPRW